MGYRLLVVDNGDFVEAFSSRGFSVIEDVDFLIARSIPEALEMLELSEIDGVLCCSDLGSSSMSGMDFLEWVRDAGIRIPFVLITQEIGQEFAVRALNLSADLYLRKDLEDREDVLVELVSYLRNRMETKQHNDQILESEQKFRNLFETAMDGIIATDLRGCIVKYNRRFAEMVGTDLESLLGKGFECFVPPELLQIAQQVGIQAQQTGQSDILEFDLLTSSNTRIPVLLSAWRREDADGVPIGSWVWARDITQQQAAEEDHHRSSAKFQTIFNESPIAIAIADKDGNIQEVNQACLNMFGLENLDIIRGYHMFSDPDLSEEVKISLANGQKVSFIVEYSFDKILSHHIYPTTRTGTTTIHVFAGPFHLEYEKGIDGFIFQMVEDKQAHRFPIQND